MLNKVSEGPVTITRRGKPVGVIVSPEEYETGDRWLYKAVDKDLDWVAWLGDYERVGGRSITRLMV